MINYSIGGWREVYHGMVQFISELMVKLHKVVMYKYGWSHQGHPGKDLEWSQDLDDYCIF